MSNFADDAFEFFKLVILEMTKAKQPDNAWRREPYLQERQNWQAGLSYSELVEQIQMALPHFLKFAVLFNSGKQLIVYLLQTLWPDRKL